LVAENSGAKFVVSSQNIGEISLPYWGKAVSIPLPGFQAYYTDSGNTLPQIELLLLLYYLNYADRTPETGEWISFSALPDAKFYDQAFQGYTGNVLAQEFQNELHSFEEAAKKLGGEPQSYGDSSFKFRVLPRVPTLVVFWQGDEDFGPSFKILFEGCAKHYLPTDGYAIIGSTLTRRLVSARK